MDHCVLPLWIDESFFADGAHANNIEALFRQGDVILGLVYEETRDLGLPQLEALELLKHRTLIRFAREVLHHDVVSVDVYCFVPYYKFFELSIAVIPPVNTDGGISNLEETFPHGDRLRNSWVFGSILYQEESNSSILFVG